MTASLRDVMTSELTRIYQARVELTPQAVVDEARAETHPLHDRFEWDDKAAGEAYRRTQAAEMIRSVRIEYAQEPERRSTRAWVARRDAIGGEPGGYVPVDEVVQDELAMKVLRRNFERELADLKRRYGHLVEYAEMVRRSLDAAS